MSDSPTSDSDARIRERAYRIWVEEGRPDGRAKEHWEMARELVAIEENQDLTTKPNPSRTAREVPPGAEPVEPAEALRNQGDFPGLRDQSEESPRAPRRKRRTGNNLDRRS